MRTSIGYRLLMMGLRLGLGVAMAGARHPFRKQSTVETFSAVLRDPPDLNNDIPQGMTVLLQRLLAKSAEDRYGSAADVRAIDEDVVDHGKADSERIVDERSIGTLVKDQGQAFDPAPWRYRRVDRGRDAHA